MRKIDVITLIGIALILIAAFGFVYYYAAYQSGSCISDPVGYANNNSHNYWFDRVFPVNYDYLS